MSRIDELQRLHEASVSLKNDGWLADLGLFRARLGSDWPAIHRVLLAARELVTCCRCDGMCEDPTVLAELIEALRALDGDKGAT